MRISADDFLSVSIDVRNTDGGECQPHEPHRFGSGFVVKNMPAEGHHSEVRDQKHFRSFQRLHFLLERAAGFTGIECINAQVQPVTNNAIGFKGR